MNNLQENLSSAIRSLRESWLRSLLSILGITIGVGSVVLLIAIGQGVKRDVTEQIDSLGTNVVIILPGKFDRQGNPNMMATLGISTLTEKDVSDLKQIPGIALTVPLMFISGSLELGNRSASGFVIAATSEMERVRPTVMEEGRFFQKEDENRRVAVLAMDPKREMFGDAPALGRKVMIRGVEFEVIGVQKKEEDSLFGFGSFSSFVYIPYHAAKEAFKGGQINRIVLKTDYRIPPKQLLDQISATIRSNHNGREDFGLFTSEKMLQSIFRVFNLLTVLLSSIAAISLVVAGIGVMNIMLVTVTERTREIGIRKTVGARQKDIFTQFITEAVTLCVTGGIIGTLLAYVICLIVGVLTPLQPIIPLWAIGLAFGVCFLVGVLFGVAPAMRAARQDPIQALRWE
jgi:putative ABC transport system permease protein